MKTRRYIFILHSDINLNAKIHEMRYIAVFGFMVLKLSQLKR